MRTSSFVTESTSWANNQQPWSPLQREFENRPCNFNVAKTNAICESVHSAWTQGSKNQIQFSNLRNDHLSKKNEMPLMPLLKKCDKVSKSVFTDPQHHCASRGNAVAVSRTPPESASHARSARDYPRKPATIKRWTFQGLSAAVKDALMSTTSSKSAGRETNNSSSDTSKTISMDVGNLSFFCLCTFLLTVSLKRSWLTRRVYVCVSSLVAARLPSSACQRSRNTFETQCVTGVNGLKRHQATSSDCRPETSCCASFPCSLWAIEIKH